jgi:hypothetical protein
VSIYRFVASIISQATMASKGIPIRGRDRPRFEKDRVSPEKADIGCISRALDTVSIADKDSTWG